MIPDPLATADPDSPRPEAGQDRPDAQVAILTPSPLYTVTIEGDAGRDPEVHFHTGGQGFWIARMVTRLEARATLCALFGGEPGLCCAP